MKYKAHIPTEQYGFMEVEADDLQEIVAEYARVQKAIGSHEGLNAKDWAQLRNRCFTNKEITMDDWETVQEKGDADQKKFINELKLAIKADL